jgi:hypothetical protein
MHLPGGMQGMVIAIAHFCCGNRLFGMWFGAAE